MKDEITSALSGGASSILMNVSWIAFLSDTALKVVATVIVGVAGGMAGLAGKDIYERIKKKNANK